MIDVDAMVTIFTIWFVAGLLYDHWLIEKCQRERRWHNVVMWLVFPASTILLLAVAIIFALCNSAIDWLMEETN